MPFFNPLNAISIAGIPVNASGKADGKALEYSASQNAIVFGTVSGGASLPLTGGTLSGPLTFSTNSQPMLNFATGSAVYDSTQRDGSTVIALVSANRTVGGLNLDNTGKVFTGFNTLDDGNGNASFTGGLTSAGYNFGFTGTVNQGMTCPSNVLTFASSNGASFAGVTGGISLGSNVLTSTAAIVSPTTNTIKGAEFNGNGSVLTSGLIASVQLPFNAIIESWRLIAMDGTASGSIHIGLSFQNFSGFNPTTTGTDLIGTGTAPNLNNQTTNTGTSSSFNGNIAPYVNGGTYLQFNVISCTGYKWVRIELTLTQGKMSSQQTTDLIAFGATAVWPFNDTSGSTTASDATGNGHTANFAHVGTSPNTFGVSGTQTNDSETCVQCGGSNAGFNAPASSAWAIGTSDFSAGVWAKISSMGSNPIVLMGQYSSIGGDPVWWLGIDSNGKPCHTLGGNSPSDASGSIVDGNWHQVILTGQNGSGNRAIKLYVDGVHQTGADLNYNSNLGVSTHAFGILNFSEDSGTVDFSSAGLDAKKAFLINGTALTQAQVTQLYNDATSSGGGGGGGTGTIAVNNSNWFFSPYNWYVNGSTYAQTVNPGAYFKVAFSGTSCSLNVDVSPLSGAGSSNFPKIAYSLDGQTLQTVQLPASSGAAFSLSGLTNTTHTLTCYMKCSSQGIDRWNTPVNVFRVTGLTLDSGASLSAPTLGTKRYLFFGDSITEGVNTLATSGNVNNDLTDNDGTLTWAALFARSQNVEYGIVGFGYQGWVHNGNGNVPDLYYSLTNLWAGQTRSFATKPDHVIINMGTNDVSGNGITLTQSNVTTALTELRGLIGTAPVTVLIPFGGYNSSTLTNAVASLNDANTSTADFSALGTYLISGTLALSADGLHPNQYADQILADAMETSAAFNGTNSAAASGPVISVF